MDIVLPALVCGLALLGAVAAKIIRNRLLEEAFVVWLRGQKHQPFDARTSKAIDLATIGNLSHFKMWIGSYDQRRALLGAFERNTGWSLTPRDKAYLTG